MLDQTWLSALSPLGAYALDYKEHMFMTLPLLWLQGRAMAGAPRRIFTAGLALDAFYPIVTRVAGIVAISAAFLSIRDSYAAWLPWANLGLLDEQPLVVQFVATFSY